MSRRDLLINIIIGIVIGCIVGIVAINNLTPNKVHSNYDKKPTGKAGISSITQDYLESPVIINNEITEVAEQSYTDQQLDLLAHLINGESGATYCSDEMRYYVGSVVLNRVNSPNFPNTISGVISQEGQYQCYIDGNFDLYPSEACYEIAEELLIYGSQLPSNVLYQAEFKQGSGVYCKVQNMYFCYE